PFPSDIATIVNLSRLSNLAAFPGSETNLVQGHVVRIKTMLSSQYHFFDMIRSVAISSKLSMESGNYIGKLRSNFLKKKSRYQEIEGLTVGDSSSSFSVLIDLRRSLTETVMTVAHSPIRPESLQVFENKGPNFNGRVDEKKFHKDFRAPLHCTLIQAFAAALTQFNRVEKNIIAAKIQINAKT
ncbi:Alanine racemase, partial [Phytophthora megakarya]